MHAVWSHIKIVEIFCVGSVDWWRMDLLVRCTCHIIVTAMPVALHVQTFHRLYKLNIRFCLANIIFVT